jgi:hypothetical protein
MQSVKTQTFVQEPHPVREETNRRTQGMLLQYTDSLTGGYAKHDMHANLASQQTATNMQSADNQAPAKAAGFACKLKISLRDTRSERVDAYFPHGMLFQRKHGQRRISASTPGPAHATSAPGTCQYDYITI